MPRNKIKFDVEEAFRECNSARSNYDSHWSVLHRGIAEYFMPQKSAINAIKPPNTEDWTQGIFDNTAINAAQVFSAGTYDYMVAGKFFAFDAPRINGKAPSSIARDWYAESTEVIQELLQESNWDLKIQEHVSDRTAFGTGYLALEEGEGTLYSFKTVDVGYYFPSPNAEGRHNRVCIRYEMTPAQIVDRFGEENVSEDTMSKFQNESERYKTKITVWQKIAPRKGKDREPKRIDGLNKPFMSYWFEEKAKHALLESGYDEQPFVVSRFAAWGTEDFGWSPSMLALPANRTLQDVVRSTVELTEIKLHPRSLVPESLVDEIAWEAGGVTVYPDTIQNKPEIWGDGADYNAGEALAASLREQIKETFHVHIFQALADSPRQRTATEVLQMVEEKLVNFRPTFARFNQETLAPILRRCFLMAWRAGKLPQAPKEVLEVDQNTGDVKVALPNPVYTSKIAKAMKQLESRSLMDFLGQMEMLIAMNPALLTDNYNLDKIIRETGDNSGIDPDFKIPEDERDEARQAAAQQEQAMMAAQMAEQGANTAKTVSDIPQSDRQMFGQMIGG